MAEMLAGGAVADALLLLIAAEAAALLLLWRLRRRGLPPAELLAVLGAGGALVLALRAALTGGAWPLLALALAAAGVAHLADLWLRWRR